MRIELKEFQQDAVDQLLDELRSASEEFAQKGKRQAVSLSSPTGSGKTVMATAAIERLLRGDAFHGPNPRVVILWITDQPELNEQTKRKMLGAASAISSNDIEVIGPSFVQPVLSGGKVYFLNTQKLSKSSSLVSRSDGRSLTIWETINQTIEDSGSSLYVFVDEAHRGMAESSAERKEADTIVQKFIKGSAEVGAAPVVVGISATLERFERLIKRTPRTRRNVDISPDDVRASGLLKEVITLFHPAKKLPTDITLLRQAAREWRKYADHWKAYCDSQKIPTVRPVFVVQVQDGSGKVVSKTDLAEAIDAIDSEIGPLSDRACAHAFQEGSQLSIGARRLRYLAPPDIDADPDVQIVFFKTSLNTGWDCPRAEVMMSFRTAIDATNIAQLIGRMVRAPLTRRVEADDFLNTVALYLPYYDKGGVTAVVKRLQEADDGKTPVELEPAGDMVELQRDAGLDDCFALYKTLPSYVIPRARKISEVKRLMKLARLLANDDIDDSAVDAASGALLTVLMQQLKTLASDPDFVAVVAGQGKVRIRAVDWSFAAAQQTGEAYVDLDISEENLEDLFELAGRKLGEGLHALYWKARNASDRSLRLQARYEIVALAGRPQVLQGLESRARQLTQEWIRGHHNAISKLSEAAKQRYQVIYKLASKPELLPGLDPPPTYRTRASERRWAQHLYVDDNGEYPSDFNKWEQSTLGEELDHRGDLLGWLRNPSRRDWSICVPYTIAAEVKGSYPDFLVFRRVDGELKANIVDPHSLHLPDAPAKAAAMAQFAAEHGLEFGAIDLIIVADNGQTKRLDLTREEIRDQVKKVRTQEHLQALFDLR